MITEAEKIEILNNAKRWFTDTVASNHITNTLKLEDVKKFKVNPFLSKYLANYLTGNADPKSIARALIYPRVLGTSITTSFGTNIQKFTSNVLPAFGSTTSGIDIEFVDQVDGTKKYCQLKAGPNTINKDDVETIAGHFNNVIHLARTNGISLSYGNLIVGVIYGDNSDLSSHYNRILSQYNHPVYAGNNFWTRLTGDERFYFELIDAIGSIAIESDYSKELERVIEKLANSRSFRKYFAF
ncbi:MAG: PmeII family type II restriction endonuclease [Candidatus Marinimicrobia bacterium]|nr:PmeII family type II restriction endonuclease [Candidatus Neomarinimicrobiota bacterium]